MNRLPSLPGSALIALLLVSVSAPVFAQTLLTLKVESSHVKWQDEFILTLEIYDAPAAQPPEVRIQGLDQFALQGTGRNLLQIPDGKTAKWILTYTLTATHDGVFQLGPAVTTVAGRRHSSNQLFITVEPPAGVQKKGPEIPIPIVRSAKELGDRVLLVMEPGKAGVFRGEGFIMTVKLLSQLPIETLRFREEADFPRFLKYEFPVSASPRGAKVKRGREVYASYELQKFLLFPLQEGPVEIPPVECDLRVRVPSGTYRDADLLLDARRVSNPSRIDVRALPAPADVVGDFSLRSTILQDEPDRKVIELLLEGDGALAVYDFPLFSGDGFEARTVASETRADLRGNHLRSRKSTRIEIRPFYNITNIALQPLQVRQFDPRRRTASVLTVPAMQVQFSSPPAQPPLRTPLPDLADRYLPVLLLAVLPAVGWYFTVRWRRIARKGPPGFRHIFRQKNTGLPVSRAAARRLYGQIINELSQSDGGGGSWADILRAHLPRGECSAVEPVFRKLEWNAFSSSRVMALRHGELQEACSRIRRRWKQ